MANDITKKDIESLIVSENLDENVLNIFNNDNKKREMLRKLNFDNLEDEAIKLLKTKVANKPDALSTKDLLDIINVTQTHSSKLNSSINDKDRPIIQINNQTTNNNVTVNELSEESRQKILLAYEILKKKQEEALKMQEAEAVEVVEAVEVKEENENGEEANDN